MVNPNIPSTAVVVNGKNDVGKRVMINSIAGAVSNGAGTVIFGPYTFTYIINLKDDKGKKKEKIVESVPYWQVQLDDYCNACIDFIKKEITFTNE